MAIEASEVTRWYRENSHLYLSLGESVKSTVVSLLRIKKINFVSVEFRVKALESLLVKFAKKDYSSIEDVTDVLGLRVILFLASDVKKTTSIIEDNFTVDTNHSVNKSDELEDNKIGYRSNHYICELGAQRLKLAELKPFKNIKFEIQIRTILEHAWAEIEHDRIYKYPGDIPSEYRRKLNLISGTLELMDKSFSELAKDLEGFAKREREKTSRPKKSEKITSMSIARLLKKTPEIKVFIEQKEVRKSKSEFSRFGIQDIGDLEKFLTNEFIIAFNNARTRTTSLGFMRSVMIFADVDRYFSEVWRGSFSYMLKGTQNIILVKYGQEKLTEVQQKYKIDLEE